MADGKSCRGCYEKCLRTHYNRHGSSFFKVMAGEFSSTLEVPSDWLKRSQIKGLKVAILEGPCGHLWLARVHFSDKLTFFTEGWEKFVSDHWIQPEDIVVFRHVDDVHFLVQVFEANGYEKKSTVTVKNCESHNLNKLGIYGTGAATFGQTVKGNPFKDASGDVNNMPRRITRSIGLKVAITGNCAEACISNGRRLSTVKQEFLGHPMINVKQEPGLPKSNWNFSENKVGSSAKEPIILDSEEESDSQASSSYRHDQDSDEVSYHHSSEVLQGKVPPVEDKTANPVKKGKPKFTQVMKKSAVTHSFWLGIPQRFGRCWFPRGNVEVLLLHQRREWRVVFVGERNTCGLGPGWKNFAVDNELKIGDICIFELEDKDNYILKVHIQRRVKEDCCKREMPQESKCI